MGLYDTPPVDNFQLATYVDGEMREALLALARAHERSMAAEIRFALKEYVEAQKNGERAAA